LGISLGIRLGISLSISLGISFGIRLGISLGIRYMGCLMEKCRPANNLGWYKIRQRIHRVYKTTGEDQFKTKFFRSLELELQNRQWNQTGELLTMFLQNYNQGEK
jgi:hypothetical protein